MKYCVLPCLLRRSRLPVVFSLVALVTTGLLFGSPASAVSDPELQAQVEQLLRDIESQPTTAANARERAELVWTWANAVAVERGFVPLNTTLALGRILNPPPGASQPPRRFLDQLDDDIRRLELIDKPGTLGTLSIDGPPAAERLSHQTYRVTYTVGSLPVEIGGRFLIARQFQSGTVMQVDDPTGDGFVSIEAFRAGATFSRESAPVQGPHGGFRAPVDLPSFRLGGTALQSGDRVTVTYGDTSGGGRGMVVSSFSNDEVDLPLYVDHGDGLFHEFPPPSFRVVGGPAERVHGFSHSIAAVGEEVVVSVRTEDDHYNRATGPIPSYKVSLNGEVHGEIEAATSALDDNYAGAIHLLKARFDKPGVYRFTFESDDGSVTGRANPILVERDPQTRLYWGETHGHSGFAEGLGSADGYFEFGRDDARLDFLTLSEHDIWMDDREWQVINDATDRWSKDGEYIVFPGYEWTSARGTGGHHNVFFRRAGMDRVPTQEAPVLSALYRGLHAKHDENDVLVIPHAHQAGDWRLSDLGTERLVEIVSGHGTFEWFGRYYLEAGAQVGFVGASDDHLGHPGYSPGRAFAPRRSNIFQFGSLAGVFAPEKTHDAIFDGLRARSAYASSGAERIILLGTMNGAQMGTAMPDAPERKLKLRAIGTAPIESITMVRNSEEIELWDYNAAAHAEGQNFQIAFESDSQPYIRDNPRGHRTWKGRLVVDGARVESARITGKKNAAMDFVRVEDDGVTFDMATRGLRRTFDFVLADVSPEATVRIELDATTEMGRAPRVVRPSADIEGAEVSFALAGLNGDAKELVEVLPVGRYADSLRIRRIGEAMADDVTVEWSDPDPGPGGDWYYVRVRQVDGAVAWTSPWWVGVEPPR